jgi:hypothetical protein
MVAALFENDPVSISARAEAVQLQMAKCELQNEGAGSMPRAPHQHPARGTATEKRRSRSVRLFPK